MIKTASAVAVAGALILGGAGVATAAPHANTHASHKEAKHAINDLRDACKKGGYKALAGAIPSDVVVPDDPNTPVDESTAGYYSFPDQGTCVSFVNHGGAVVALNTLPADAVVIPYPVEDDAEPSVTPAPTPA